MAILTGSGSSPICPNNDFDGYHCFCSIHDNPFSSGHKAIHASIKIAGESRHSSSFQVIPVIVWTVDTRSDKFALRS